MNFRILALSRGSLVYIWLFSSRSWFQTLCTTNVYLLYSSSVTPCMSFVPFTSPYFLSSDSPDPSEKGLSFLLSCLLTRFPTTVRFLLLQTLDWWPKSLLLQWPLKLFPPDLPSPLLTESPSPLLSFPPFFTLFSCIFWKRLLEILPRLLTLSVIKSSVYPSSFPTKEELLLLSYNYSLSYNDIRIPKNF